MSGSMMIAQRIGTPRFRRSVGGAPIAAGFQQKHAAAWILGKARCKGAPAEPAPTTTTSQCSSVTIPNLPRLLSSGPRRDCRMRPSTRTRASALRRSDTGRRPQQFPPARRDGTEILGVGAATDAPRRASCKSPAAVTSVVFATRISAPRASARKLQESRLRVRPPSTAIFVQGVTALNASISSAARKAIPSTTARQRSARDVARFMPIQRPRAERSQCGHPRPDCAGANMTPLLAAEGPSKASSSSNLSSSPTLLSHSTAAPAVRTPPSSAKAGFVWPSRHAQVGRSPERVPNAGVSPVSPRANAPVPKVIFTSPGLRPSCPKRAAC